MSHDPQPHDHSELSRQLRDSRQELAHAKLLIDKLKTEIAYRMAAWQRSPPQGHAGRNSIGITGPSD